VIALSLVFFAARYASPVYQTLALLVFAYAVRFFPQALSGLDTGLARVGPRVEEAARGLGRGPISTAWLVTVPLVRSGALAGAALVFLSAMKELPATILLRPIRVRHARDGDLGRDPGRRLLAGRRSRAAARRALGRRCSGSSTGDRGACGENRRVDSAPWRATGHSVDEYLEVI
jgi:hypothetical protein